MKEKGVAKMLDPEMEKLEKKAYRGVSEDGLMEIMLGATLMMMGAFFYSPVFMFYVVFLLLSPFIAERVRKRYTYPRIGRAKFRRERPRDALPGVFAFLLLMFLIVALIILLSGDLADPSQWARWSPLFFGLILLGPMFVAVNRTGDALYYWYGIAGLSSGAFFSLVELGPDLTELIVFMLTLGGFILACGVTRLVIFVKRNPIPTEEMIDG